MSYPRYRAPRSGVWDNSPETHAQIAKAYAEGASFEQIRVTFKCSFGRVKKILKDAGVQSRPDTLYTVNEGYFDRIDTHTKAYFIGLLMADGCVTWNRPRTMINQLHIALQRQDGEILEYLANDCEYTGKVKQLNHPSGYSNGPYLQSRLSISNITLVSKLTQYGLTPCKSVTHPFFLNIPEEFICSAILGYFDGDGSVSYHERDSRRLSASFICSILFADELVKVLHSKEIPCSARVRTTKNGVQMKEVRLKGNRSCLKLYRYMYQGNIPSLPRKKNKFEWVMEQQRLGLIKDTTLWVSSNE